ncbi:MAG: DHH family phosphoesterase [Oscillospiraceae bacterium]|nr:DHH family phosphoesterase [Oscillospiraceae bacterium]
MKKSGSSLNGTRRLILISLLVLICFSLICASVDIRLTLIGMIFAVFELTAFLIYSGFVAKRNAINEENISLLGNITLDFLMQFTFPLVILDAEGGIVWYNRSFSDKTGTKAVLYGLNINEFLPEKLNTKKLFDEDSDRCARAVLSDVTYDITSYSLGSYQKLYYLTVWQDKTELIAREEELRAKNPVISYIAVDNYSEASGYHQNDYRAVTAKISILLQQWASGLDGILGEVERDRYILIIDESHLSAITDKKFDILDEVRDISKDNVDIPVTVSIGTACVDGTFAEKEAVAHTALDLALQRGGDQAVVKTRGVTEFYGGKTKTVQKRTKIRSRIIAGELTGLMKKASNVLIMGHRYADHDSVGACVGIARLAFVCCDKINIIVNLNDYNLKPIFQKLRGIDEYKTIFIDSSSAQDLITPDTLLVILDVNNCEHFESIELYENTANVVIIDHHRKTGEFTNTPKVTYIEPSASSASELVAEILEQAIAPGGLLKEEAEILFSGIILDTKQFTRNTGTRTFAAALYLRGEGANPAEAQMLSKIDLKEFIREIKFENNVVIYRNIIAISVYDGKVFAADKIAAAKAADRLLNVDGVLASFVLCEIEDAIHISSRSSGSVNVQLILERLDGGGHYDAAGAQLKNMPMKTALSMLKEAIDYYLNQG